MIKGWMENELIEWLDGELVETKKSMANDNIFETNPIFTQVWKSRRYSCTKPKYLQQLGELFKSPTNGSTTVWKWPKSTIRNWNTKAFGASSKSTSTSRVNLKSNTKHLLTSSGRTSKLTESSSQHLKHSTTIKKSNRCDTENIDMFDESLSIFKPLKKAKDWIKVKAVF